MGSFVDGLKGAIGDAACFVSDKLDQAASYTFGTAPGSISGPLCDEEDPPPPLPPPFSGGQCQCVPYTVNYRIQDADGNDVGGGSRDFLEGPIIGAERRDELNQLGIVHGHPDCGGVQFRNVASGFESISIASVTPTLGGSDDCGNPPPPPPSPPGTRPINFTYVNNEGDNVSVSGDVNIGIPILIAPFTLVAPIKVDLGGVQFDGSIELAPEFGDITISPSFGGGGGGGGDLPTPLDEDDEDPDDDDPDSPVECRDFPLKGLVVGLNFSPEMRSTELRQDGSLSSIAVPRAATLYFIVSVGNRDVYMPGIDLKRRSQYIPAPYNATVTCWRIHTEPGVTVASTRPVFDIPN